MSLLAISAALEVALAAMSPPLATAWENAPFSPVVGTPYQQVTLLAATPDNPEVGRFTVQQGYLQIDLKYPLNAGKAAALTRAELIKAAFPKNANFTHGGFTVVITRTPEIAPARTEPDRYVIPVRIYFRCNYNA